MVMNAQKVYPVDRVVAGYNIVLALIWAQLVGLVPYAPLVLLAHVAAAFMPRLIERAPRNAAGLTSNLRDLYPLLWMLAFWTELDYLRAHLHQVANDASVMVVDRAIFGIHLHSEWIARMPQPWLSELMQFSYELPIKFETLNMIMVYNNNCIEKKCYPTMENIYEFAKL